jgi:hypothetical protein
MNNPALPNGLDLKRPFRLLGRAGGHEKIFAENPVNPLISLDSHERIQGNPSFSNPQKLGFSPPNGEAPRKPKMIAVMRIATTST